MGNLFLKQTTFYKWPKLSETDPFTCQSNTVVDEVIDQSALPPSKHSMPRSQTPSPTTCSKTKVKLVTLNALSTTMLNSPETPRLSTPSKSLESSHSPMMMNGPPSWELSETNY